MSLSYRDLTSLHDFASVVALEREIWGPGYDDVVPTPVLAITVKRGGILIGAFEQSPAPSERSGSKGERMVGFVYSIAALRDGRPTQWSHMLGVLDEFRSAGVGFRLKLLQRERALAMGFDLIEWTFDPLQAVNAHLNFAKLGIVVEHYEENAYGESASPLHGGNPTDRFIAEWWIGKPHVKPDGVGDAPPANRARAAGDWLECADVDLSLDAPRIIVEIPVGFTAMLSNNAALALAWRLRTREIFTTYFARGYRAVDFRLDAPGHKGTYLIERN